MNVLELFAGAGGGILASQLLGHRTVCAVELNEYRRAVLIARQNDKTYPPFPIWDNIATFDGRPWRGIVDIISGGFPCQNISSAGDKKGLSGSKSGLWSEMERIIREIRPKYVFMENSPLLVGNGLTRIIRELTEMRYNIAWHIMGASDINAPHKRKRIWILAQRADPKSIRCKTWKLPKRATTEISNARNAPQDVPDTFGERCKKIHVAHERRMQNAQLPNKTTKRTIHPRLSDWWEIEPNVGRVAHGVAHRIHRLESIGLGQVPGVAALSFLILQNNLNQLARS